MKSKVLSLMAVLILVFVLSSLVMAAGIDEDTMEMVEKARSGQSALIKGEPMVGLTISTLANDGWLAIYSGVLNETVVQENGLITFSAENSVVTQMNQMEDLITKGVKSIVLNPVDSAALSAAVKKANNNDIPVITVDRSTTGGEVAALVQSNNEAAGKAAAELMSDIAGDKKLKVLVLQGDLATSAGVERDNGFQLEAKKSDNLEIVSVLPANWKPEKAQSATLDAFQAHPEINAIYLPSDNAYAEAVFVALKQLGKFYKTNNENHVVVVSVDGGPRMLKAIKNGYADGSAGQDLYRMGSLALELSVKAANGEEIEQSKVNIPPQIITSENVNSDKLWGNAFVTE